MKAITIVLPDDVAAKLSEVTEELAELDVADDEEILAYIVEEGLQAAFTSIFPISSHSGNARLEFVSFSLLPPSALLSAASSPAA